MIRLGVIGNLSYDGLPAVLERLIALAPPLHDHAGVRERAARHRRSNAEMLSDPSRIDALLTLGGDGTMLRGARLVAGRQIPVLGVNLGRLGFLTACAREDMELAIERLAAGDYLVQKRMTLEAWTTRHPEPRWRALNDVVVHKGGFARVFTLRASVNGELMSAYAADGVIISSPTGSTGYSLSAGGPDRRADGRVADPHADLAAHARDPPRRAPAARRGHVQVDAGPDELLVTIDGQVGATFFPGDTLTVRRADKPVLAGHLPRWHVLLPHAAEAGVGRTPRARRGGRMLTELRIRNFAIIDALTLPLAAGFNVLTGETGAGKSIIVGALGFLLGERGTADLIRTGADKASVEGIFDVAGDAELLALLDARGDGCRGSLDHRAAPRDRLERAHARVDQQRHDHGRGAGGDRSRAREPARAARGADAAR